MSYDIIGDIHGCNQTLTALLHHLDYVPREGVYQHPDRRIIFLGDFIDRGPGQREVIEIVRPMIESGAALSVMGNHEFNAIAYFTPDGDSGDYLRKHSEKNTRQHCAFLDAYGSRPQDYADVIEWFRTLPLWLELEGLNIVHACWDSQWIDRIKAEHDGSTQLGEKLLLESVKAGSWQFEAIETLLKGKEVSVKPGCYLGHQPSMSVLSM